MLSPVVNTVPEMLSRTCAVASSFPYDSQRATSPAPTSTTVVPDAVTVTVAVWAIAVPLAVAETVFVPATVELNVPVATPLASVGPLGWVSVLPLPVAASTTVAPLIGFPLASCAVTVIVEVPLSTTMDAGEPPTVDCAAETDPAATVTPASWVIAVPFAVAATVFGSATVELNAPVATPLASVGPVGCVRVFPAPVAASTTVAPLIGLPPASRAVTVMVALALPAVRAVGEAVRVDCDADTGAGSTVTVAVSVRGAPSIVAEMVFVSAPVELRVPVATPLASVGPLGWVSVLSLPVTARTTVAPLIGFPLASRAVTVMVASPLARAMNVAAAASVDAEADTDPADTVTVAVCVSAVPFAVADRVFASATVELRIPVAAPLALVVPLGWLRVLPLPVAERITVTPLIGFPPASFTVTVIVELPLPAASDVGDAETVDCEADTAGPAAGAPWHAVE